jgi:glycine betaine transporter
LWFAIFGGTAIWIEMFGGGGLTEHVFEDVTRALFAFFGYLPMTQLLNVAGIFLIYIFLVTGADSGTFVISMMAGNGNLNPSTASKIAWGLLMALITLGVLLAGSIEVAKAMAITGAIPYTFIVLLQVVGFLRALREERFRLVEARPARGAVRPAPAE